jgi:hypothetical protein
VSTAPVYNDAAFRAQFPAFASTTLYPQAALEFAWNMGGSWINQDQPTAGADVPVTNEGVGTGTGSAATFTHTAANLPVVPGTVVITAGAIVAVDNGSGGLTGTGIASGAINYASGVLSVTYVVDPVNELPITMNYSYTGSPPPVPCGYTPGCLPPWCQGFGMSPKQLQQAADLMGAVMTYQFFGPVTATSGGGQSSSQDGEAPGAVASATEGSISASFQLPAIGSSGFSSMLLASPPYGRALLALLQIAASVGPYFSSGRSAYIPP